MQKKLVSELKEPLHVYYVYIITKKSTSANKLVITYTSHSTPTRFDLKSDSCTIQSVDPELLGRTHDRDHSIKPLLLAVPQPYACDAVYSAPIVEPSL